MSLQERILNALREAREQVRAVERRQREPIAVVGIGCRFPGGVNTPDDYWRLLCDGVDAMTEVPPDRWDIDEYYDPDPEAPGKVYAREAGHVSDLNLFDPQFFRISPREALTLDPQQRLLLEVTWEALEDAGESADAVRGSNTGFYVGFSWHDYERNAYGMDPERLDAYAAMGNTQSIAIGRLAFMLGAHGPTSLMDTACSSSLVAVHTACQTLRSGEADMIVAGGVNLMISPLSTIFCCKVKALSPDSRCKTFDAAADGYARGEGCGMVVLKRLSDALADGNRIRAVIRGTAINHDGPSSGLTVPNRAAQLDVIRRALNNGDIDPLAVGYVEAHGTGTSLGDPIEVGALGDALGEGRAAERPLRLGSCKTNFGHLEAAAGIAGLIKAVLAIEHDNIPPHLHFRRPSPNIDWEAFPVEVPTANTDWQGGPRVAGVSSFGFSGTNAHVILEQAPEVPARDDAATERADLLCLSARDDAALRELAQRYVVHLRSVQGLRFPDVCHTANTGRARFSHRLALAGADVDDVAAELGRFASGGETRALTGKVRTGRRDRIAFLFTGQGSQWPGMGKQLYRAEPHFREAMDRCAEALAGELGQPLLDVMFGETPGDAAGKSPLDSTAYTQPALFALEWSLAQLWQSWGVEPALVMGHSVGEYVAACVAGVFSVEDGLRLMAMRGRLMQALPEDGLMAAVDAAESVVAEQLPGRERELAIAAVNGPRSTVISGKRDAVRRVSRALEAQGVEARELAVSHAFHSPLMNPMLDEFERFASGIAFYSPRIALVSNVSGAPAADEVTRAEYWRRHITAPVQFESGMHALETAGASVYLELGPHPVLLGMGRQCIDGEAAWVSGLRKDRDDVSELCRARGELFVHGVEQDFADRTGQRRRVRLPTYPFQRKRYWVEARGYGSPAQLAGGVTRTELAHPLLGQRLSSAALAPGDQLYEVTLSTASPAYLAEHRVFDQLVPPATCYLEIAFAVARTGLGADRVVLEDFAVHQPLFMPDDDSVILQCVVSGRGPRHSVRVSSFRGGSDAANAWALHASGTVVVDDEGGPAPPAINVATIASGDSLQPADCYARFAREGLELGPAFQVFTRIGRSADAAWAEVDLRENRSAEAGRYALHPALLDSCGQLIACAFPADEGELYLPVAVERVTLYRPGIRRGVLRGRLRPPGPGASDLRVADIELFDHEGQPVLLIEGATTRLARRADVLRSIPDAGSESLYECAWTPAALPGTGGGKTAAHWLLFGDDHEPLARLLEQAGDSVTLVGAGENFATLESHRYSLNLDDPDHYRQLLGELEGVGEPGSLNVVVLAGVPDVEGSGEWAALVEARSAGRVALLLQALAQTRSDSPTRLWLVTRGTRRLNADDEAVNPFTSGLWGLGSVMVMEHPELQCVRIDLPLSCRESDWAALRDELRLAGQDDQVVLREKGRYVARLQPLVSETLTAALELAADAVYLITGGFGALGSELAQTLVSQGVRRLALVGRRGPGPEDEHNMARWREQGVDVRALPCDVASPEEVDRLLRDLLADGSRLGGVFHVAGQLDDGVLLQMNEERMLRAMQSKVAGGWNLHRSTLSLPQPPDHFVMFSSAASLLGSRGQANYAAANAFLDALAHFRRQQGLAGLSVNWGPWGESGMAAQLDERATRRMLDMGWSPLTTAEGMNLLQRLMTGDSAQAGVLPLDWGRFVAQYPATAVPAFYREVLERGNGATPAGQPAQDSGLLQRLQEADPGDRRGLIGQYLAQKVAALIGLDGDEAPDRAASFPELGIDSLLHMELRSEITRDLEISLPVTQFLDHPSIETLTELVLRQIALSSVAGDDEDEGGDMEEFML